MVLLRYHGLALLMLTLALGIMLQEAANALEPWTGGFDGLSGITPAPLFGAVRERPLWPYLLLVQPGRAVAGLPGLPAAGPFAVRPVAPGRARERGADARARLRRAPRKVLVFTVAAALAGLAGGLFAQANAFVTLDVFSFHRSGTVLIVLILGGAGRLYGAFVGGTVYYLLEDQLAKLSPEFWQFGVGLPWCSWCCSGGAGCSACSTSALARWRRAPLDEPAALETRGLCKSFGGLAVAANVDLRLELGAARR